MRYVFTGLLGAALLFGCGDDDGGDDAKKPADSGAADSGSHDSGVKDAGSGSMDASVLLDGGIKDSGPTSDASGAITSATATLESKSGTTVGGNASFKLSGGLVTLTLTVTDAEPGMHGAHIHDKGDCSTPDATSAGGHWSPVARVHGSGAADAGAISHLGDLGNIVIAGNRTGTLTHSNPEWKLGDHSANDVLGHAIVIHKNQDDLVTNTSDAGPGMSGARVACGVIR